MKALHSPRARLRHWLRSPVEVPLVCEIAADYVAAVRHHQGRIHSWAVRALPEGAVRPAPLGDNVAEAAAVHEALQQVVRLVADGHRRCALLVPDLLARVTVLEFDRLPENTAAAEALLRWRLGKDLPFDVRQAVLSYHAQPGRGSTHEAVVAVCLRSLLRQYEECVERLGLQPGWVTLSTLAALGCVEPSSAGARLLVKRDHGSLSLAVVHGRAIRLFRSLPAAAGGHALNEAGWFEKVYPAVVYFQDQWAEPLCEVVLAGASRRQGALAEKLEREAGCPVREFSLAALKLPPSAASGADADHRLVSSLGWAQGEAA